MDLSERQAKRRRVRHYIAMLSSAVGIVGIDLLPWDKPGKKWMTIPYLILIGWATYVAWCDAKE